MGFFKKIGKFATTNIKSAIRDVSNLTQGVVKPILDSESSKSAIQGIIAAKTGGAGLASQLNQFGGVGTQQYGPNLPSSQSGPLDFFKNVLAQVGNSTGASKDGQGNVTTNNQVNNTNENTFKKFIKANKFTLIVVAVVGFIVYLFTRDTKKVTRRRTTTRSKTAREKQLAALAKGRRTRLRNLRAKKKK